MNEVQRAKHEAATKLQEFVNGHTAGVVQLHDVAAHAFVEAMIQAVIVQFGEHLRQAESERASNGN